MSPELAAAYRKLYDIWNRCTTLESDLPRYSLLANGDVNALDDAAGAIEDLLCRPDAPEPVWHGGGGGPPPPR